MLRYSVYLEEPTLASYRLDYCPRNQLATVLVCPWVVVTGESGETYNVMRALPLPDTGLSISTARPTGRSTPTGRRRGPRVRSRFAEAGTTRRTSR